MNTFMAGLVLLFVSFPFAVTLSTFTLLCILLWTLSFAIFSLLIPFHVFNIKISRKQLGDKKLLNKKGLIHDREKHRLQ